MCDNFKLGELRTRRIFLTVVFLLLALTNVSRVNADTVRGLYVGDDFYTPNMMIPEVTRASGFTRLFLSFLHVDGDGNIAYNNTQIINKGQYIGDYSWGEKLAALKAPPSSVDRIELVVGGDDDHSFTNIKKLITSQGTGSNSILYKDFQALKNATGTDAIQLDDEQTFDVPSAVALGTLVANLGMKVTLCPCTVQDFWTSVKSQLGTNVDSIYLQCFKDGSGNDPASWIKAFNGFKVYPGLWGDTDSFASTMRKMRNWRQTLGITGGFIWLNGHMPDDTANATANWAAALKFGLNPISNLRIVNKCSGKSLNLIDGKTSNGSSISQLGYDGENNWRWMLVPVENGNHLKIVSWVSGQCVSIAKDSSLVGAQIWSWDYNNDPSQQFDLVDAGNGWFKIKNVRSGLVLELPGGNSADYTPVQQNIDTDTASQMWKFYSCEDAVLACEYFNYPVGALIEQNRGEGWSDAWSEQSGPAARIVPGSLEGGTNVPPYYDTQSVGNSAFVPNAGRVVRHLDCSANGPFGLSGYVAPNGLVGREGTTLYLSFLQKPARQGMFCEFQLCRGTNRIAGIGNNSTTKSIGFDIPNHPLTLVGPFDTNVSFYVIRIDFKRNNDNVLIYRNATSVTEPPTPTVALTNIGKMCFDGISLTTDNGNTMAFDQLRIATCWQQAVGAAPQFCRQASSSINSDDILRRVRISAQVLSGTGRSYYLIDGNTGVHITLNQSFRFEAGDTVDVSGLVLYLNPFVDLIEATACKTGCAPLPKPMSLDLVDSNNRMPWVWAEGILTNSIISGTECILEIQALGKKIAARVNLKTHSSANWPLGSRLKITGIYLRYNSPQPGLENENSFQITLDSPAAVELIERPPWWTLKRVIVVIGGLLTVLSLAFLWITLLRRQVALQTIRLKREITQREQADQAHAIEQERARISRDLHDDLGSKLTQISMLAWLPKEKMTSDLADERLRLIAEQSRCMTSALDEVVWMMNPKSETLSSFTAYLAGYTEEFLAKSDIEFRVDAPVVYQDKVITSEARNNLFFAVKEAVNNAVRHGKPTKLTLKIAVSSNHLMIFINDNGCGYDPRSFTSGMGIGNIRDRMLKIDGLCHIESSVRGGTTIVLKVSL